ncbi:MAG: recombinase family protein [Candidatus Omnitrophota bacterium]
MKIGYLRVSTDEQRPDRQIDGLRAFCDETHIEKISAATRNRPVYERVIARLEAEDTFVVWDLDRAFRSTIDALLEMEKLHARGVNFQIVNFNINTATNEGELAYTIIAAFAQFERKNLIKRTKEGMAAARRRGKHVGRPYKLRPEQIVRAYHDISNRKTTITARAAKLGCARDTLSRAFLRLKLKLK